MGMGLNFLELQDDKQAKKMLNSVISEFPERGAAGKALELFFFIYGLRRPQDP